MLRRTSGAIVCDRAGRTTPHALFHLQLRGELFVGPNTDIYEGMIRGEHIRRHDLIVNGTRERKLTNFRTAQRDDNVILSTPPIHTIDSALEFIDRDEHVAVTPDTVRLRRKTLAGSHRRRKRDPERISDLPPRD